VVAFPARGAKRFGSSDPKPLFLAGFIEAQPMQLLALRTTWDAVCGVRLYEMHVRPQTGNQADLKFLSESSLHTEVDVSHVAHRPLWRPAEPMDAPLQRGVEEDRFAAVGWSSPADKRDEQDGGFIAGEPQSQSMLLVANEPSALAGLDGATSQGRTMSGISTRQFFLKALVAAGRSVASISPTQGCSCRQSSSKPVTIRSLIIRRIKGVSRERNSCN
jgi:hypothetical protein